VGQYQLWASLALELLGKSEIGRRGDSATVSFLRGCRPG
jgi:hypothetical protein